MNGCPDDCPVCGGYGVVRGDFPVGHKNFGKLLPCPKKSPYSQDRYLRCGLDNTDYEKTFADLLDVGNTEEVVRVFRKVMNRGYGLIYLWGTWGNGKSNLLMIAVAEWLRKKQDETAAYVNTSDVISALRKAEFSSDGDDEKRSLERWAKCTLLCFDEFEKVRSTPYGDEKRFRLLDERYLLATRKKAITVFASNIPPKDYAGEIFDRLRDRRVDAIEMTGESVRTGMMWDDDE